jgi:hypothetical protein
MLTYEYSLEFLPLAACEPGIVHGPNVMTSFVNIIYTHIDALPSLASVMQGFVDIRSIVGFT